MSSKTPSVSLQILRIAIFVCGILVFLSPDKLRSGMRASGILTEMTIGGSTQQMPPATESRAVTTRWLFYFAFAARMIAGALDVGSFFHCLALGAAVFAGRYLARADGVRTFCGLFRRHFFSPNFTLDRERLVQDEF
jgi:hypothetical protein